MIVILGVDSDPRFLAGVPAALPFVRHVNLRFAGSGTTGEAGKRNRRRTVLLEVDPRWCAEIAARARWATPDGEQLGLAETVATTVASGAESGGPVGDRTPDL